MDDDMLLQKFHHVSRDELYKRREMTDFFNGGPCEGIDEISMRNIHERREKEKIDGRGSHLVGPLVHLLSAHFVPDNLIQPPLTIYGQIYYQSSSNTVHHLYNRNRDHPQVLGPTGSLTLTDNLGCSSYPPYNFMSLHNTKLVVDVSVGGKTLGAQYTSFDEDEDDDFEQIKLKYVRFELGVLALRYIAVPFAVCGRVDVFFHRKPDSNLDEKKLRGKIVARYGNGYDSECTLFEKQSNEFERVEFDSSGRRERMRLSRHWLGMAVYSSIVIDFDILEFGSERNILKEKVEFRVEKSHANFIVDDILIEVDVNWFSPLPQGTLSEKEYGVEPNDEFADEEMSLHGASIDDSDDEQMNESCDNEASSNLGRPWHLRAHQNRLFPCSAVQIFSIFIGRENLKALEVYGCVEVSSIDGYTFYGFNRESEDAFGLPEKSKTLPVQNGSLVYDDSDSLEMKIEIKDVESRLHIKGYVDDWNWRKLEFGTKWLNKQLCSVVQGEHGFVAIHYSIFPEAVQANIGVMCTSKLKNGNGYVDISPKVYGTIVAQYNNFDHTTRYAKDYYRVILFQRNYEDPAKTNDNGVISLSRSMIVVPLNSSIVIEVNLLIGDDQVLLKFTRESRIGTNDMTMENNDYSLRIDLKWVEVSN